METKFIKFRNGKTGEFAIGSKEIDLLHTWTTNSFVLSLQEQFLDRGTLTARQWDAFENTLDKLADAALAHAKSVTVRDIEAEIYEAELRANGIPMDEDEMRAEDARCRDEEAGDGLSGITEFLAFSKVQFPKFYFRVDGERLALRFSRRTGKTNLVSRDRTEFKFGRDAELWLGAITPEGAWMGREPSAQVKMALALFANNPSEFAAAEGHRNGECCFCGKELSDPVSVELGFGPVCARSHGLNHKTKVAA